ncbi:hypothetical protein Tco_0486537 [Tanacetum coccineum]
MADNRTMAQSARSTHRGESEEGDSYIPKSRGITLRSSMSPSICPKQAIIWKKKKEDHMLTIRYFTTRSLLQLRFRTNPIRRIGNKLDNNLIIPITQMIKIHLNSAAGGNFVDKMPRECFKKSSRASQRFEFEISNTDAVAAHLPKLLSPFKNSIGNKGENGANWQETPLNENVSDRSSTTSYHRNLETLAEFLDSMRIYGDYYMHALAVSGQGGASHSNLDQTSKYPAELQPYDGQKQNRRHRYELVMRNSRRVP